MTSIYEERLLASRERRAAQERRKLIVARHAPAACQAWRLSKDLSLNEMRKVLHCTKGMVHRLEKGDITSWKVAEAVLILNGFDFAEHGIEANIEIAEHVAEYLVSGRPIGLTWNVLWSKPIERAYYSSQRRVRETS